MWLRDRGLPRDEAAERVADQRRALDPEGVEKCDGVARHFGNRVAGGRAIGVAEAGVDLRPGTQLHGLAFDASGSVLNAVTCSDGSIIATDSVLVGIGLVPDTALAQSAGLAVDDGILVDEYARTSDPHIVAAGDCANHPSSLYACRVRLESVSNAIDQARTAVATLLGKQRAHDAVPWFWSDQYDVKLQIAGLAIGHDRIVMRGEPLARSFAAFYLRAGRVLACHAVNRPQEFLSSKRLVAARCVVDADQLADESIPMSIFVARSPGTCRAVEPRT